MNLNIREKEIKTAEGEIIRLKYYPEGDILDGNFDENVKATGVELTDDIILRVNRRTGKAVSLTFLHFSILTEKTEYGPRSFPLNDLSGLNDELQDIVVRVLKNSPVEKFLKIVFFQETPVNKVSTAFVDTGIVESAI